MILAHLTNYSFVDSNNVNHKSVNDYLKIHGLQINYEHDDSIHDKTVITGFTPNPHYTEEKQNYFISIVTESASFMYLQNPDVFLEFINSYSQISEPLHEKVEIFYNQIIQFVESSNYSLK